MSAIIYYDGDCPFCARYAELVSLRESVGDVTLANLREDLATRRELESEGFDLDVGMVVEHDGTRRGGAEAARWLAVMSGGSRPFDRLNRAALGSPLGSKLVYPLLRAGRWLALLALGRDTITDPEAGTRARRTLFAMLFAFFSFFHVLNYWLNYERGFPGPDLLAVAAVALVLLFRPASVRLLTILMVVSTVSAVIQAPAQSNHTMVRNVVLLGWWLAFGWAMMRGRTPDALFRAFAPAGMGALLVMYFFGIFHKINRDFLDPVTSCATELWRHMPAPLAAVDGEWMGYLAVYGTFAVEGGILLALFVRRLRHFAIVAGIGFHLLIGLSGYSMYISFTTLSIALHMLWLNGEASRAVLDSPEMEAVEAAMRQPVWIGLAFAYAGLAIVAGLYAAYTMLSLLLLPLILPVLYVVVRRGGTDAPLIGRGDRPGLAIGAVVSALFFANCALPYFGSKSAQAVNMFANLRLEGGRSNHLVVRDVGPYTYLDEIAVIHDADPELGLDVFVDWPDMGVVYYDLLAALADHPGAEASFTYEGVRRDGVDAADMREEIETRLHPRWVRKWFHFQPAMISEREVCNL